jgi:hypothetical protein
MPRAAVAAHRPGEPLGLGLPRQLDDARRADMVGEPGHVRRDVAVGADRIAHLAQLAPGALQEQHAPVGLDRLDLLRAVRALQPDVEHRRSRRSGLHLHALDRIFGGVGAEQQEAVARLPVDRRRLRQRELPGKVALKSPWCRGARNSR